MFSEDQQLNGIRTAHKEFKLPKKRHKSQVNGVHSDSYPKLSESRTARPPTEYYLQGFIPKPNHKSRHPYAYLQGKKGLSAMMC